MTSLVLLCALPMMIALPWLAHVFAIPQAVSGAWIGGTLDTSGSVAAAAELVGDRAVETGMIVKISQNVLIGVAAIALSVWWSSRDGSGTGEDASARPSLRVVWERFPKFVLGFVAASLAGSFLLDTDAFSVAKPAFDGLRNVFFAAAFVCIGLETRFADMRALGGGRPALAFIGGQAFNVVWTLLLAFWLFG